jgi:hypothetical protein
MIVSGSPYPNWQIQYRDAILETDTRKLRAKVLLAEWKIFERFQAISGSSDHYDERLALAQAVKGLRTLEVERLKYPDWSRSL